MNLMDTSRELFSRPTDEHLGSFLEAKHFADTVKRECRPVKVSMDDVKFRAHNGAQDGTPHYRIVIGSEEAMPSHFLGSRLVSYTGFSADSLSRLSADTAARALQEGWDYTVAHMDRDKEVPTVEFLLRDSDQGTVARCVVSDQYSRLWDADILDHVDRWLLPVGYVPAVPTMNQHIAKTNEDGTLKPALFIGDRSSHFFFYSDREGGDDGLGGLRTGIVINNSEVGHRSFDWKTFTFREMCGNFIIWDASQVAGRRVIHKTKSITGGLREFRQVTQGLSNKVSPLLYDAMSKSQHMPFVTGKNDHERREKSIERLRNAGLTKENAERSLIAAQLPENIGKDDPWSVFSVAQGVSWVGKNQSMGDQLLEMGALSGRLLAKAGV